MRQHRERRRAGTAIVIMLAAACLQLGCIGLPSVEARQTLAREHNQAKPSDVPPLWKGLVGEYVLGIDTICILEHDGVLCLLARANRTYELGSGGNGSFIIEQSWPYDKKVCMFKRNPDGTAISLDVGERIYRRVFFGEESRTSFRIKPLKPVTILQRDAELATPPKEEGEFLHPDLVEVVLLDSTIHLDIRYATSNNFVGEKFYSQARAFLQRPAAAALMLANRWLHSMGYGLLIHDAYRPWYVTKMFWDATPVEQREFVADPSKGSRHNRGCAVDLSLYDLKTGQPVPMVSGYDEFSHRAYPGYPGGTSLQRWHRALLQHAMESEGFTVFESEWWHFDYKDWRRYAIGTIPFEMIH